jgi:hypothetical protein
VTPEVVQSIIQNFSKPFPVDTALGDIIIGPGFHHGNGGVLIPLTGNQHHCKGKRSAPDMGQNGKAIAIRKAHIGQNQIVILMCSQPIHSFLLGVNHIHTVLRRIFFHLGADQFDLIQIVFDIQDSHGSFPIGIVEQIITLSAQSVSILNND